MTSDLEWPEWALPYSDPSNIVPRMDRASDPYRFVLAQPLVGNSWDYSGGVRGS